MATRVARSTLAMNLLSLSSSSARAECLRSSSVIIGREILRSLEAFAYKALGRAPKLAFLAIYLVAAGYA